MNDYRLKRLKQYIRPSLELLLMGLSIVAAAIVGSVIFYKKQTAWFGYIFMLIFFILGAILVYLGIWDLLRPSRLLRQIEAEGKLELLLDDFLDGDRVLKGSLILGKNYIISKRTGTVTAYEDLTQVYQYIHQVRYYYLVTIEDRRYLKAVSSKEKGEIFLCKLKLNGKSDHEVNQVIKYLLYRNPQIKVGCNN